MCRLRRKRLPRSAGELLDDERFVLEHDDALDHVLELTDIARPVVLMKLLAQRVRAVAPGDCSASRNAR